MSTGEKRSLKDAEWDAMALRELFAGTYEAWEIAGSVRRLKPFVSDVEHVVIPKMETVPGNGLFAEPKEVNALWMRAESLVARRAISPATYTDKNERVSQRWGEKYRGILFRGFKHEIFTATALNWGAQLLNRTGPAEYSERVVTMLKHGGMYRQQDGNLIHVASGEAVVVPDEETYCQLAGIQYQKPEDRT